MNALTKIDVAEMRPHVGFTALEYVDMLESGAFGDLRVELIRGELRKMMPSDWQHGEYNVTLAALLKDACKSSGARVGADVIIALGGDTVRAGDVVVVRPGFDGKRLSPADVVLVVEIANTTLGSDLGEKSVDYATAGVAECWVVDVNGRDVHIMTLPTDAGYQDRLVRRFGEPLPVPGTDATITID